MTKNVSTDPWLPAWIKIQCKKTNWDSRLPAVSDHVAVVDEFMAAGKTQNGVAEVFGQLFEQTERRTKYFVVHEDETLWLLQMMNLICWLQVIIALMWTHVQWVCSFILIKSLSVVLILHGSSVHMCVVAPMKVILVHRGSVTSYRDSPSPWVFKPVSPQKKNFWF